MAKRSGLSARLRFRILRRDGFTCQYCGARAPDVRLHVDHRDPWSRSADDSPENLVAACEECNLGKGALRDFRPADHDSGSGFVEVRGVVLLGRDGRLGGAECVCPDGVYRAWFVEDAFVAIDDAPEAAGGREQ